MAFWKVVSKSQELTSISGGGMGIKVQNTEFNKYSSFIPIITQWSRYHKQSLFYRKESEPQCGEWLASVNSWLEIQTQIYTWPDKWHSMTQVAPPMYLPDRTRDRYPFDNWELLLLLKARDFRKSHCKYVFISLRSTIDLVPNWNFSEPILYMGVWCVYMHKTIGPGL